MPMRPKSSPGSGSGTKPDKRSDVAPDATADVTPIVGRKQPEGVDRPEAVSGNGALQRRARRMELASRSAALTKHGLRAIRHGLVDEVLATAPKLPVRSRATLRDQYPGLTPDQVASMLIHGAVRTTGAVGAAAGAWAIVPIAPAFPVDVMAETLAVVGIEVKLVAELHEVYGLAVPGTPVDRMTAYLTAWVDRHGGAVLTPGGLALAIGSPLRKRLSRRLARRAGRNVLSLGPLLTGAAAGALLNRRETRRVGEAILTDLQRHPACHRDWS
jgi:hypothetical protein